MRQTLLRILFGDLWAAHPGPEPQGVTTYYLGFGWLLVPWALFGLAWAIQAMRTSGGGKAIRFSHIATWAGVAAGILLFPMLIGHRMSPDGLPIRGYGFMLFLGFVFGGWSATRRAASVGVDGDLIWDLAMWIFFSGIAGARVFYLVQKHEEVFAGKNGIGLLLAAINLPDGGLVLYGGVLLGIAAFIAFCRVKKLSALLLADITVPSLFIGVGFGRIGCFLNGCCWGDRCELPWAVRFPAGSVPFGTLMSRGFLAPDATWTLPLHPTQIYSSLDAFVLAFVTAAYFRVRPKNGAVLAVGWLMYPVTRFLMEFLRGDELGQFHTSLTIAQWVSIGLFVSGLAFTTWLLKRDTGITVAHPVLRRAPSVG